MALIRQVVEWEDDFLRQVSITGSNFEQGTGWKRVAAGTGTPTVASVDGATSGAVAVTLDNSNNSQYCALTQGDQEFIGLANLHSVEFIAKVSGIDSVTTLVFGVAGGGFNTTIASTAPAAFFKMLGSSSTSAVVVDSYDGTTSNTSVATSQTLSSTYKRFVIDFSNGLADVRFYMGDSNGQLARVAASTTFSMAAASSSAAIQPYVYVSKASGTGTPAISIDLVKIISKRNS